MTPIDWALVVGINGAIVIYGLRLARGTKSSVEWFLASKALPWWAIGLSMFATAVDSGDYVAVAGGAYKFGISNLTTWWIGISVGWLLVAYLVLVPLYRSGMFTNAEYLEARFGPIARVLSVVIQIQSRTNVLGNIGYSLFLIISLLTGWGNGAYVLVGLVAFLAAVYTATGGLRSVAVTDAFQSIVMLVASFVLWWVVWNAIGGWTGLESRLEAADPKLAEGLLHARGHDTPGVPPLLMVFGWILILSSYCVINQSQAMRMLAARSTWDLHVGTFVAIVITSIVMWFNITLGILGRGWSPDLGDSGDHIFPLLINEFLTPGLVGLVVAGIFAGAISSYDSIGSALAALFTRDVWARFLVKDRDDRHYLWVSRFTTVAVIAGSFLYIPYIKGSGGMLVFYMRLMSVGVLPLFAVYLMGTLTRAHRKSGTLGLAVGVSYGLISFLGDSWGWPLPFWWTNMWWTYLCGLIVTCGSMVLATLYWGWERKEDLRGLVYGIPAVTPSISGSRPSSGAAWLEQTRREAAALPTEPSPDEASPVPWYGHPLVWSLAVLAILSYILFVRLW